MPGDDEFSGEIIGKQFEEYLKGYNDRREEMIDEHDGIEDLRLRMLYAGFSSEDTSKIIAVVRGWLDT